MEFEVAPGRVFIHGKTLSTIRSKITSGGKYGLHDDVEHDVDDSDLVSITSGGPRHRGSG